MVPLRILTLIVISTDQPSILVLEPLEEPTSGKSRIVPVWIGGNEATQIGVAIEHVNLPRPMPHDLFLDAITNLDACVDHVLISDVKGQTFFAQLVLRQNGRLITLDARPTDAIALAIRQDAPFYIDETVLDQSSFPYIFKESKNTEVELQEFRSFLEGLTPDDFEEQF